MHKKTIQLFTYTFSYAKSFLNTPFHIFTKLLIDAKYCIVTHIQIFNPFTYTFTLHKIFLHILSNDVSTNS
jgi:hypothetical protein